MKHPAKYSDILLPILKEKLSKSQKILDPFAGTGKIRLIRPDAYLLEIEKEWAIMSNAVLGDALDMPWEDNFFDAICTSPTYGNRMADNFIDKKNEKKYIRNTYRHCLGRELNSNNSGKLNWGKEYCLFHEKAWKECHRILQPQGIFVLNISDHIRRGMIVDVTNWHINIIINLGFILVSHDKIKTKRNRFGQNNQLRVEHESIIVFRKER